MASASPLSVDLDEDHEDLTTCSICLSLIERPKALPCLHTYCTKCLSEWAKPGSTTVTCPICRKIFTLPDDGVEGLENNFFVTKLKDRKVVHIKLASKDCMIPCTNCEGSGQAAVARCVECDDFLCENCLKSHKTLRLVRNHHTFTLDELRSGKSDPVERVEYCTKHKGQVLWIFCKTCGTLICRDCTVFDHCKPEHDFVDLQVATKGHRDTIHQLAKECKKLATEVNESIKDDSETSDKLEASMQQALRELSTSYESAKSSFLARLDADYNRLSAEMTQIGASGRKEIEIHTEELRTLRSQLRNSLETASQLTQTGSDYDVAQMYASVTSSLQELCDLKHPPPQKNRVEEVIFKASGVVEQPAVLGSVSTDTEVKPTKDGCWTFERKITYGEVKGRISYVVKGPYNGDICFVDNGKQAYVRNSNGACKCLPKNGHGHPFGVTINAKGEYFTTCSDTFVYRYLPNLTEDPRGAFSIVPGMVQRGAFSIVPGMVQVGLRRAFGITIDRKQQVVVGEIDHKGISIHTEDGARIEDFKVSVHPHYITANSHDQLAVSCYSSCCKTVAVVDMTNSGHLLFSVYAPTGVKAWYPRGVCWNKDDDLFVVNTIGEKGIHWFSSTGDYKGCVVKGLFNHCGLNIVYDKMLVADKNCIIEYSYK